MTTEVPKSIVDAVMGLGTDHGYILAAMVDGKMSIVQGRQRAKAALDSGCNPQLVKLSDVLWRVTFTRPRTKVVGAVRQALDAEMKSRTGCLALRKSRATGTLVGLYRSADTFEVDVEWPYTTVCEDHSTLVSHKTLADARANLGHPEGWCDACRGEPDESEG